MQIIGGKYKGLKLNTPKGLTVRPTSGRLRETVFNILQNSILNSAFLDVFAGSGAIGFEALSRGAESVSFLDADKFSIQTINKNLELLNEKTNVKIYHGDALEVLMKLSKLKNYFDVIYVDPPYEQSVIFDGSKQLLSIAVLKVIDAEILLKNEGILFIEEGKKLNVEEVCLKNLSLKRIKKQGRTFLHEFYLKPTS